MKSYISPKMDRGDEDAGLLTFSKKIRMFQTPLLHKYDIFISGEIGPPEDYVETIQMIRSANSSDLILFHLNSPGGDINTALQLIEAIDESKANTVAIVAGICASAATYIFLACDSWEISEHASFMIHTYSSGTIGKGNEMHDQVMFFKSWSDKFLKDVYQDFLSKDEIEAIIKGADLWLSAEDVGKRLDKKIKTAEELEVKKEKKPKKKAKTTEESLVVENEDN